MNILRSSFFHPLVKAVSNEAGIVKPLLVFGLAGGLVFLLISGSTTKQSLVSYEEFKEARKKSRAVRPKKSTAMPELDSLSESHEVSPPEISLADKIKPVINSSNPGLGLPRETLEHIQTGMQLVEFGKFNAAEQEFKKAAATSPSSPEVHAIWATSLRMQKKFKGADRHFKKAFDLAPKDHEIAYNWGMSKLMAGEDQEAINLFKKAVGLNPDIAMYHNSLGKAIGRKKDYPREEAHYRKAIQLDPKLAVAHFNLAVVLGLQNKIDDAVPHFNQARDLDPQFNKPFVQRFLQQYSMVKEIKESKETGKKVQGAQTAKLDKETANAMEAEGKAGEPDQKMEGSKGMEGSEGKVEKKFTQVKGTIKVNGKGIGRPAVILLETKDKLRVPGQQTSNINITQSGLKFHPAHSVVRVGSTVTFVNEDRDVHNIYSKSMNNQFNLGAMAAGSSKNIIITEAGPIVLRCNLHKEMVGTIFAVPNGYFTQPDQNGNYIFEKVKSKEYIMQVWHPRLYPHEIENAIKSVGLLGKDRVYDFDIHSDSEVEEIHDLVDETDYVGIVDEIEKLVYQAIEGWKAGKKYSPRKTMLVAITKHYGEDLKGAIAKSFSEKRSANLEEKLDAIRKKISNIKSKEETVTEDSLKNEAAFVISQLRNNVKELKARLDPQSIK